MHARCTVNVSSCVPPHASQSKAAPLPTCPASHGGLTAGPVLISTSTARSTYTYGCNPDIEGHCKLADEGQHNKMCQTRTRPHGYINVCGRALNVLTLSNPSLMHSIQLHMQLTAQEAGMCTMSVQQGTSGFHWLSLGSSCMHTPAAQRNVVGHGPLPVGPGSL